jgi:hypothetical protein
MKSPNPTPSTRTSVRSNWFQKIANTLILALLLGLIASECLAQAEPAASIAPAASSAATAIAAPAAPATPASGPAFPTPPTKVTPELATVPEGLPPGAEVANSNFDYVSWETFVALNWPADAKTCSADLTKTILSGTGPVVWETYLADTDVFKSKPNPWCGGPPGLSGVSADAQKLGQKTGVTRFFGMLSKFSPTLSTSSGVKGIQEVGGALTDKNGRFVRYEIRMNQDEYNYIVKNNLWNKAGQAGKTISFPMGKSTFGPVGAMEIKAAWKVLGDGDDPTKFYNIQAIVFNDAKGTKSPGKNPVTLGLVGLHILHKAKGQSKWLWSTFEQNDNLTSFSYPSGKPNAQTANAPYTELDLKTGKPLNLPVNVTRLNPIENPATEMNAGYQKLLAGSVWANYSLVATQWAGNLGGMPKPAYMANTVIETYTQGPTPPSDGPIPYPSPGYQPFSASASSSCMKCHSVAKDAQGANGDFSFLLGNAK